MFPRKNLWLSLVAVVVLLLAPRAFAISCSCSAPNGSCTASASCARGCYAFCSNAGCDAGCFGGSSGPIQDDPGFGPSWLKQSAAYDGPPVNDVLVQSVSLQLDSAPSAAVSDFLSSQLGARAVFVAKDPEDLITVDAKGFPANEIVKVLGRRGGAAIASGGEITMATSRLDGGRLSEVLSGVLGFTVVFTPKDPGELVSLSVNGGPIDEVLQMLSTYGTVSFAAD